MFVSCEDIAKFVSDYPFIIDSKNLERLGWILFLVISIALMYSELLFFDVDSSPALEFSDFVMGWGCSYYKIYTYIYLYNW